MPTTQRRQRRRQNAGSKQRSKKHNMCRRSGRRVKATLRVKKGINNREHSTTTKRHNVNRNRKTYGGTDLADEIEPIVTSAVDDIYGIIGKQKTPELRKIVIKLVLISQALNAEQRGKLEAKLKTKNPQLTQLKTKWDEATKKLAKIKLLKRLLKNKDGLIQTIIQNDDFFSEFRKSSETIIRAITSDSEGDGDAVEEEKENGQIEQSIGDDAAPLKEEGKEDKSKNCNQLSGTGKKIMFLFAFYSFINKVKQIKPREKNQQQTGFFRRMSSTSLYTYDETIKTKLELTINKHNDDVDDLYKLFKKLFSDIIKVSGSTNKKTRGGWWPLLIPICLILFFACITGTHRVIVNWIKGYRCKTEGCVQYGCKCTEIKDTGLQNFTYKCSKCKQKCEKYYT